MDCMVTTALKSSLHKDMAFKSTQPLYFDDLWVAAGGGGGINNVPSDDFSVDDLLDFSGKDFTDGVEEENASILEVASQPRSSNSSSSLSENDHFGSLLAAQLAVPADDLESLEWLSQFVDDSQSELSMLCAADGFNVKTGGSEKTRVEPVVQIRKGTCISQPVPRKPRSIRPKPQRKSWSVTTSLAIESSSFSSSSSYGSSTMSPFVFGNPVQDFELFSSVEKPPPAKKQKKKKQASQTGSGSSGSQAVAVLRKCSHCQVQKTPQWRTGPLGPKTLCNACGVRFKSGRLFPEYRPALSPTFSLDVHSNSHRKVLEMRKKKDPAGPTDAGLVGVFEG